MIFGCGGSVAVKYFRVACLYYSVPPVNVITYNARSDRLEQAMKKSKAFMLAVAMSKFNKGQYSLLFGAGL
jgi:hypothetical protein